MEFGQRVEWVKRYFYFFDKITFLMLAPRVVPGSEHSTENEHALT